MVLFLSFVTLSLLVGLLSIWRQNRELLAGGYIAAQIPFGERTSELERANEDLRAAQADLQRR